jgi:hypothetical protein
VIAFGAELLFFSRPVLQWVDCHLGPSGLSCTPLVASTPTDVPNREQEPSAGISNATANKSLLGSTRTSNVCPADNSPKAFVYTLTDLRGLMTVRGCTPCGMSADAGRRRGLATPRPITLCVF